MVNCLIPLLLTLISGEPCTTMWKVEHSFAQAEHWESRPLVIKICNSVLREYERRGEPDDEGVKLFLIVCNYGRQMEAELFNCHDICDQDRETLTPVRRQQENLFSYAGKRDDIHYLTPMTEIQLGAEAARLPQKTIEIGFILSCTPKTRIFPLGRPVNGKDSVSVIHLSCTSGIEFQILGIRF